MNQKHPELQNTVLKIQWIPGEDSTMDKLDAYAKKVGLQRATAARLLIRERLSQIENE